MSDIFISYRRGAASPYARGIYERLEEQFGSDRVFMDIDTMEPGVDFVEYIHRAVGSCRVLIVVISPDWVSAKDNKGQRRLDDPEDFVRVEVTAALERDDVRVIPVLVGDAPPPTKADLPPDLAPLTRRQALEVADGRWDHDMSRLARAIEKALPEGDSLRDTHEEDREDRNNRDDPDGASDPPAPQRRSVLGSGRQRVLIGAAAVLAVAAVLFVLLTGGGDEEPNAGDVPAAVSLTTDEMDAALDDFGRALEGQDLGRLDELTADATYAYLGKESGLSYQTMFDDVRPADLKIITRDLSPRSGVAHIRYSYADASRSAKCPGGYVHGGTAEVRLEDIAEPGAGSAVKITAIADRPHLPWETSNRPARTQTFRVISKDRAAPIGDLKKHFGAGSHCVLIALNANADGLGVKEHVRVKGTIQMDGAGPTKWGTSGRLQRGLG